MKFSIANMKYKLLLVTLGLITFASCKKYLDVKPVSGTSADLTFDNVQDAQRTVLGVYQDLTGDYGYGLNLSIYYNSDNDETMGPGGTSGINDGNKKDLSHYNVSSAIIASILANPFNQLYAGIERANNCIKYIPAMNAYSNGSASDKAKLRSLYGQSLTLRAMFYFDLVKIWGDVPGQFVPSADVSNLFLYKMDRDSIYDQILGDLKTAENLVPWQSQSGSDNTFITQDAVRGLRARIALFRGGYSLRQSGQMVRGSNWQQYYQIAKDECDTIIQLGSHKLNNSFQSIFQDGLCKGVSEPKEVLFQISMYGAKGYDDSKLGVYNGPKVSAPGTAGSGGLLILPNYFYLFDSTDARRDVTCAPFTLDASKVARVASKLTAVYDGKFRRDWVAAWPTTTASQYLGENWPVLRYSDILLMYAEADNDLNNGPSQTDMDYLSAVRLRGHNAIPYGPNDAAVIGTIPTTHDDFFDAIVKERSLEFGGENLRKYDLIRWNLLATKIQQTQAILQNMLNETTNPTGYTYNGYVVANLPTSMYWQQAANGSDIQWLTSFYGKQPNPGASSVSWMGSGIQSTFLAAYAYGFVPNKSELFPFHQSVISANPNITQNPNYH